MSEPLVFHVKERRAKDYEIVTETYTPESIREIWRGAGDTLVMQLLEAVEQERARADAAERERDDLKAAVVSWVAAKRAYDAGANATLSEAFQQSRELGNCDEVLCRFADAARAGRGEER